MKTGTNREALAQTGLPYTPHSFDSNGSPAIAAISRIASSCRMHKREDILLEATTTRAIIDTFRDVHRALGFGYREYIYALAMERDLVAKGHQVDREVAVMVYYRGEPLAEQTLDMIVDRKVIVENKASERLHPTASVQLFSYLCSTNLEVGLLLHFGRDAKFYRMICENRFKHRSPNTLR